MTQANLRASFLSLQRSASTSVDVLSGMQIPGRPDDYLALAHDGAPVILLAAEEPGIIAPEIRLQHLTIDFAARCRISDAGTEINRQFVLLTCGPNEPALFGPFLDVVEAIFKSLPLRPTANHVHTLVSRLTELFRKLTEVPANTVKGLWAELFTILHSEAPGAWVQAWHLNNSEKFDFVFDAVRVEVKSTERVQRIHEFALDQIVPPIGVRGVVASVPLRSSAGGVTVENLALRLLNMLKGNGPLIEKVWANVVGALGTEFADLCEARFDEAYSRQMLRFIETAEIPRPEVNDPSITMVRFSVDLTQQATTAPSQLCL